MRIYLPIFAVLFAAAFSSLPSPSDADDSLGSVATKKMVEEAVGTPVSEGAKDMYDFLVRQNGSRLMRRIFFQLASIFGDANANSLAKHVMAQLKSEVFNGRVNEKMWARFTMELYYRLMEWWNSTPENPMEAAHLGVWHALVALQKELFGPALRGSPQVEQINKILLDPDLTVITGWVSQWKTSKGLQAAPSKN